MKSIYKDEYDMSESFVTNSGNYISIIKDSGMNPYYHVTVKIGNARGKTVASRCRIDKAMEIAKEYDDKD